MGTRNLTMVISGGAVVVAQYGQWDGYPSGQGQTILDFLNGKATAITGTTGQGSDRKIDLEPEPFNIDHFRAQLAKCYFGTEKQIEAAYAPYSTNGMMNMDQAERFKASNVAYLSRDTAATILPIIYSMTDDRLMLQDERAFANDGLFCEFAYVVDLDAQKLEVYTGFHKTPPAEQQRFCGPDTKPTEGEYYPVQLAYALTFAELAVLDALPEINEDADEDELVTAE